MQDEIRDQSFAAFTGGTSTAQPAALTPAVMREIYDLVCPILYYCKSTLNEPGTIIHADALEIYPEYIVVHPDDLERLRVALQYKRRLVHVTEWKMSPDEIIEVIKRISNVEK